MPPRDPYLGDYLQSDDLPPGKTITVTIAAVIPPHTEKAADGRLVDKMALAFEGKAKKLILGKTNWRIVRLICGSDPEKWPGQEIRITVRYGDWFGFKDLPTLRIVPPADKPLPFGVRKHYGREFPSTHDQNAA